MNSRCMALYFTVNQLLVPLSLIICSLILTPLYASADDDWQFEVTPYLFATSVDATVSAGPIQSTIDADFNNILDNLEFAIMGEFVARNNRLLLAIDTAHLSLEDGNTSSLSGPTGRERARGAATVSSKEWIEPVIGGRVILPLATNWDFIAMVDVGGFGVGSELTYQSNALAKWQFSKSISAKAGYRLLYQDFEEDAFRWEVTYKGLIVGLGINF